MKKKKKNVSDRKMKSKYEWNWTESNSKFQVVKNCSKTIQYSKSRKFVLDILVSIINFKARIQIIGEELSLKSILWCSN